MVKNKLLKISLAVVCAFSFLALVGRQTQESTTMEMASKDDKPSSGEIRDGGPGSGFILFSVGVN